MITWVKKANSFQIAEVLPQGVAYLRVLIFCQFQPSIAYKSVAYIKKVRIIKVVIYYYLERENENFLKLYISNSSYFEISSVTLF